MADKLRERRYLEIARSLGAIPSGSVSEREAPDFVIRASFGRLGIEITELSPKREGGRFSPMQVDAFRKAVVSEARDLHTRIDGSPVDVQVYFLSRPRKQALKTAIVKELADFIRSNYEDKSSFFQSSSSSRLPEGIIGIAIAPPLDGTLPRWSAKAVGLKSAQSTIDALKESINKKQTLLPLYKQECDKIWLMIIQDDFMRSRGFAVWDDVDTMKFESDFDKVMLLVDPKLIPRVFVLSQS